jgi:ComF family protein
MSNSPSWESVRSTLAGFTELIWPRVCFLCDGPIGTVVARFVFCEVCRAALTSDADEWCPRCASTIGPNTAAAGCPSCRGERFHFVGATRLGRYDARLRDAVLAAKQAANEPMAVELGRIWAEHRFDRLPGPKPTLVVPVPLHWWRRWERGYNQSAAIARGIAEQLRLPLQSRALVRTRPTPPQTTRTPTERRENVRGAFRVGRFARVRGERVLLVDDVLTTGATADAAAASLVAGGAAQVTVAVIAHR